MSANTGIPGIPDAALNAIADANVQTVLRAIVDGLNVRNGASGSGDNRFVTASELAKLQNNVTATVINNIQQGKAGSSTTLTPGEINRVINDLQASIMESALFKALGNES